MEFQNPRQNPHSRRNKVIMVKLGKIEEEMVTSLPTFPEKKVRKEEEI